MDIEEFLTPDGVMVLANSVSRKQLFQVVSIKGEELSGIAQRKIFDALFEREQLGSTGVGGGIAIPHGKIEGLDKIVSMLALVRKPVEFETPDGNPVDVVFVILAPEEAGADHLKVLAKVSRTLRDPILLEKIRGCDNPAAIYALLSKVDTERAA